MPKASLKPTSDALPKKLIGITVLVAALLPEYIAPFLTFASFLIMKLRFSESGQKVRMGRVGKVFFIFMCFSFISCFWSFTPIYSAAISLLWMGMLLGSFCVSNLTADSKELHSLFYYLSLGGGLVGLVAAVEYVLLLCGVHVPNPLWSLLDNAIYHVLPIDILDTTSVWGTTRASSTFDNPLICATYLVMVLPFAVCGFLNSEKKRRLRYGVSVIFILLGTAATVSRGAALAVIASLAVLMFLSSKKSVSISVASVGAAATFLVVIIKRIDIFAPELDKSADSRLKMWTACARLIRERPIFGYGAGTQSTSAGLVAYGLNKPHAHSLYFEMTTELGIVGIVFFAVVFGFIIYDIVCLLKKGGKNKKLGVTFLACVVGFLVASLTEFTLQTPKELQYFMLILGLLEAAKRISASERGTPVLENDGAVFSIASVFKNAIQHFHKGRIK